MVRDARIFVQDILQEIRVIEEITVGSTVEKFAGNPISYRAAVYAVLRISEASRNLPQDWISGYPALPWASIHAIGNKIRHEYFRLDDAILWNIMTVELAPLKAAILDIAKRHK